MSVSVGVSAKSMNKVLVVVPARGGSKRILRKNLATCAGRPLLGWTLDAAQRFAKDASAADFDVAIVVSTDDAMIADCARTYGVNVVDRPAELATDEASTDATLRHAVFAVDALDFVADVVVTLQPTVPVRDPNLVLNCFNTLCRTGADSVLTAYPLHFVWWREDQSYHYTKESGSPTDKVWRSQCGTTRRPRMQDMKDREIMLHEDGSVYVSRAWLLRTEHEQDAARIGGHVEIMHTRRSIDIDDADDLAMAEALLTSRLRAEADDVIRAAAANRARLEAQQ